MAYNQPYNPDALPRFAEPEHKGTPPPSQYAAVKPLSPRPPPQQQQHHTQSRLSPHPPPGQYRSNTQYSQGSQYGQSQHGNGMSPPPVGGQRPPPVQNRPSPASRPPPSPAPGDDRDPTLLPLFRAVDKNGTGQLSERELSAALVNGDWTAFDPHTVRMMIRMFDSDRSGTIGFDEFCGLWSFLASWRTLFDRFDVDRSGNIQLDEFRDALIAFRYRLSERFVELLFQTYDKRNEGQLSFDLFVQACISLKRMTDVFKKYDDDRDGYITLSFEDFLTEILRQLK
ncbi:hypothetical protein BD289DRAFT_362245 [Coniella lustricola]|uniref:EF-hand domain-containing protein n=1 Tax=Coniella lustricola TaxID=2025994 RepID=A0A2T3AGY2_9PEZI|nr:hypothetical protein BD289DRAFT_362245 [Coniella lustricola]